MTTNARRAALLGVALAALSPDAYAQEAGQERQPPGARQESRQAVRSDAGPRVSEETRVVPGLRAEAEILVDRWGIPHITAASEDDAFFVQGFNAARDRLWQIDLWRRRGLGLLSEAFGPDYVEQDRAARLFLFRGDARGEWLAYGNGAQRMATRFVEGINAYVRWAKGDPSRLPPEFRLAGYEPSEWALEDVVRIRSHGLTRNVQSEVRRAQVMCGANAAADTVRQRLEPADPAPRVPDGLDPCSIPVDVLRVFDLATRNAPFGPQTRRADSGAAGAPEALAEAAPVEAATIGSNNWAVAPRRTGTGRALLANDPHRAHGVPSLRYVVHLRAPGMDVIGAGEPALPGISIGHNGTVAFGLTIFAMDQEDLYVYETDAADPESYVYRGRAEPMRMVRESIPVRGEAPREVALKFTRHGPVVAEDAPRRRAYAIRSVWLEPGTAPYFGGADYARARDVDEFLAAMDRWGAPSENQVYADTRGTIAWVPGGLMPVRRNWDGLLPVPGDGRYEWDGFLTRDRLPVSVNPPEGFVYSANENNLPPGYDVPIGREWADPSRSQRVQEVLAASNRFTVEDAQKLQMDVLSRHGLRLAAALRGLSTDAAGLRDAVAWIGAWDGRLTEASPQGALVELWFTRHLRPAVVAHALPEGLHRPVGLGDATTVVELMERPDARLGESPDRVRDEILSTTLRAALSDAAARMGADRAGWAWGKLHTVQFDHPMAGLMGEALRARSTVGPAPKAGSGFTVSAATYAPGTFRLTAGASFRMVVDVGDWDASRVINTPGQSGDPRSPHYNDLFEQWRTGQYVPMLYSHGAVQGAAEHRIRLTPR